MASASQPIATNPATPITIKVVFEGSNRKFKLPLQDLNAASFSEKIRTILQIPENQRFLLERFSDSGNAYVVLDQNNPSAYKQLYRAAKAKLKLRIRATLISEDPAVLEKEVHKRDQPTPEPIVQPFGSWLPHPPYSLPPKEHHPDGAAASVPVKDFGCLHARDQFFHQLINLSREREMGRRMKEAPVQFQSSAWQIFCNECDKPLADAHFHCSICDGGDYDLCETCVEAGKTCEGEGHWLIKRFIKHGRVVNSTTETLPPKPRVPSHNEKNVPGAFDAEVKVVATTPEPSRTCNSCVRVLPEGLLYTCKDCPDFDLCVPCLSTPHGHHPAHTFVPIDGTVSTDDNLHALCAPGRNMPHLAICDGCDARIYGVRNKCLKCPDWDFCSDCFANASSTHPGHRFVPVYDDLGVVSILHPRTLHYGILCDGPLCAGKTGKAYIKGIRYKCAVCHDTDFCANCEAHPSNKHNETHPLVKFKTPVKGANITTVESKPGQPRNFMGDKIESSLPNYPHTRSMMSQRNASTQSPPVYSPMADQSGLKDEVEVVEVPISNQSAFDTKPAVINGAELDGHYVRDTVIDGTQMLPSLDFTQSWTVRNPGPHPWPLGCNVFQIGGDQMRQVENCETLSESSSISKSNATTRVVEAGQEFEFTVCLKSPARLGNHISYWRVKAPDGTPFGHKLWCDIKVVSSIDAPIYNHRCPGGSALCDYQTQLLLLEEQNKRRLATAAATKQDGKDSTVPTSTTNVPSAEDAKPASVAVPSNDCVKTVDLGTAHVDNLSEIQKYRAEHLFLARQALSRAQAATTAPVGIHVENVTSPSGEDAMVFPTLEKESPASSTYQDATTAHSTTTIQQAEVKEETEGSLENETETESETVATGEATEERFEDLESIEYEDSDGDDGFMTDEEYDILDASDEEVVGRGAKSA